jgi:hypothetical protein
MVFVHFTLKLQWRPVAVADYASRSVKQFHPRGNGGKIWRADLKMSKNRRLPLDLCEELSNDVIYELSLQGQSAARPHYWKHPHMMNRDG